MGGQVPRRYRAITSHDRLSDDRHATDRPTDDRLAENRLTVDRPTELPLIEPTMAPIEPTLALIEPTAALIIEPTTAKLGELERLSWC